MPSLPNRDKLIKMILTLVGLLILVWLLSHFHRKNSLSLSDYAQLHPEFYETQEQGGGTESAGADERDSSQAP